MTSVATCEDDDLPISEHDSDEEFREINSDEVQSSDSEGNNYGDNEEGSSWEQDHAQQEERNQTQNYYNSHEEEEEEEEDDCDQDCSINGSRRIRFPSRYYRILHEFCQKYTAFPSRRLVRALAKHLGSDPVRISRYFRRHRDSKSRPTEEEQEAESKRLLKSFSIIMKDLSQSSSLIGFERRSLKTGKLLRWKPSDAQLLLDILAYYARNGNISEHGMFRRDGGGLEGVGGEMESDPYEFVCRWFKHLGGSKEFQSPMLLMKKHRQFRGMFYRKRSAIRRRCEKADKGRDVERRIAEEVEKLGFMRMKSGFLSNGQPATYENLRELYVRSKKHHSLSDSVSVSIERVATEEEKGIRTPEMKQKLTTSTFPTPQSPPSRIYADDCGYEDNDQYSNDNDAQFEDNNEAHDEKENILFKQTNLLECLINAQDAARPQDNEKWEISDNYDTNQSESCEEPPASPDFLPDMLQFTPKRQRSNSIFDDEDESSIVNRYSNTAIENCRIDKLQTCVRFVEQLQFARKSDFCRALGLVEQVQSIFFCLSDSGRIRFLRDSGFEIVNEQEIRE